jgi:hypothetical protein
MCSLTLKEGYRKNILREYVLIFIVMTVSGTGIKLSEEWRKLQIKNLAVLSFYLILLGCKSIIVRELGHIYKRNKRCTKEFVSNVWRPRQRWNI